MSRGTVTRVAADGEEMLCKARRSGLNHLGLVHQLASLQRMDDVCGEEGCGRKLLGYVKHVENGCIVGFLQQIYVCGSSDTKL